MAQEQAFIRGRFSSLEAAVGPFFELERPHPMTELVTARQRASELETLLERVVDGRRRSWKLVPVLAVGYAAIPLIVIRLDLGLAGLAGAYLFGLLVGVWDRAVFWWFWPLGSRTFSSIVLSRLPSMASLNEASRSLHDAVRGLNGSDRGTLLDDLRAGRYPLLAVAARTSWTLLPGEARDELRQR